MTETPLLNFSDADLQAAFRRALRNIGLIGLAVAVVLLFSAGWQTAALLLIGAGVSASTVWEAQRLILRVNDRLDQKENSRPLGPVVAMFFLRLLLIAGILYVSLKSLHGSVFALVFGLALAAIGLTIEALRVLKG